LFFADYAYNHFLQYTGWYDEPTVGGIEGSLSKMMKADPDFGN